MNHLLTYLLAMSAVALFALVFWVPRSRWLEDRGSTNADQQPPAGGTDAGDGPDSSGGVDGDGPDPDDDADTGADNLGDAGKQALDRMKAERNAARRENRDLKRQLADATKPPPAGDTPDPEALKDEGRREALVKANERILRSEIKAAAAGKLTDPTDALRLLELTQFEVDDDGNVDEAEIADAIDDLIKTKPYLSAQGGKRFQGGGDGGVRNGSAKSIDDQIAEASAAGNHALAISLKRQKAYAKTP